jgi:hypothetical protein
MNEREIAALKASHNKLARVLTAICDRSDKLRDKHNMPRRPGPQRMYRAARAALAAAAEIGKAQS